VLDRAIAEAGIDRREVFVTNAVKHFKFEPRGKRRLHKKPNAYEIDRCRWWNNLERQIVHPALRWVPPRLEACWGEPFTISKLRGSVLAINDIRLLITNHPSYLLRIEDKAAETWEYERLVTDLKTRVTALDPSSRETPS
jgi:uracil-DNA glycosylase